MDIQYADNKIEKIFCDHRALQKAASSYARVLKRRIDQLKAANTYADFADLGVGKPHQLNGDLCDCIGISITGNYRLIIKPRLTKLTLGKLMLCEAIIVKGVADYHGEKYDWIIP